jgi:hypothetical protein
MRTLLPAPLHRMLQQITLHHLLSICAPNVTTFAKKLILVQEKPKSQLRRCC